VPLGTVHGTTRAHPDNKDELQRTCMVGGVSVYRGREWMKKFSVVAAIGGERGLNAVAEQGPFALIFPDMR
jgi:hypothetical protein